MRSLGLAVVAAVLVVSLHAAQQVGSAEIQLQAAINKETIEGDLKGAIVDYQRLLNTRGASRAVAATALLHLGQCHEKLGNAEARRAYEQVLKDYADQAEVVRQAKARLATLAKTTAPTEDAWKGRRVIGPSNIQRDAVSPDGRYIADCCMSVREIATGRVQEFPVNLEGSPRFSPDSQEIAYIAHPWGPYGTKAQVSSEAPALRVAKRSGSDERVVLKRPSDVRNMSLIDWMPDAKDLLVWLALEDKTTELALVPVAGGSPRRVKSPAQLSAGSAERGLSPDGRFLAYRAQAPGAGGAWMTRVLTLDGSADALLVDCPANAWNIGWTGEGRFAFYSGESGSEGVWAVRVVAGKAQGPPERVGGKVDDTIQPVGLSRGGAFFYHKRIVDLQVLVMRSPRSQGASRRPMC